MSAENHAPISDPGYIYDLLIGYWKTGILKAAIELDVFSRIAAGADTVESLAAQHRVKERGMQALLDSLCGLRLLLKTAGRYRLSPAARQFLVRSEPGYIGGAIHAWVLPEDWDAMGRIEQAVREGEPLIKQGDRESTSWVTIALGLLPLGMQVGPIMCDLLNIASGSHSGRRILDIACGSGVYGYSILQRDRTATVTGFDLPDVLAAAATVARDMDVADRVTYHPGTLEDPDFGIAAYDVAIISHILQGYDPPAIRMILRHIGEALQPGGTLVIHEFVPDEQRAEKSLPLLFAMFMIVETPGGGTYTFPEYSTWLAAAGFENPVLHDLPTQTSLILARKKQP